MLLQLMTLPIFALAICLLITACSDSQEPVELGEAYVVDLTSLPTTGEGMLILEPGGTEELAGHFQVGPYSVDIRVALEVAEEAGIDTEKPFEDQAKVIIYREDEQSSGFHRIYRITSIETL